MKSWVTLLIVTLFVVTGCEQRPAADAPSVTPHRTDFVPEEFGAGRAHTQNTACNRQIDQLLGQVSDCYNTRPTAECDQQMRTSSDKIARIKNSMRCRR